jgi:hypothetical protein
MVIKIKDKSKKIKVKSIHISFLVITWRLCALVAYLFATNLPAGRQGRKDTKVHQDLNVIRKKIYMIHFSLVLF